MPVDDLSPGVYVTILEWKERERTHTDWITGRIHTLSHQDNSWVGDVMRVEAVDLPFLAVSVLRANGAVLFANLKIDTRRVELKKLSPSYVQAMTGEVS